MKEKRSEAVKYLYDYIKIRTSAWKNSICKVKRQIANWEKYLQPILRQGINFLNT